MLFTSEAATEGHPNVIKPLNLETAAKNHPFKISCLRYIKANFNKISQREMARRLRIGKTTVNIWSKALGLFFKKHTVNENYFERWTPEMAYILGYIITDGNIAWDPAKCYNSLTITACAKDEQHLERIRALLHSTKPLLFGESTNSYRLIVVNKKFCQDLMKLGIPPRKSLTVRFPEIPKKYLPHFVRGVIDGDGSVRYFRRPRSPYFEIMIASGSQDFIRGLHHAIKNAANVDSSITRSGNCLLLRYTCQRGKFLADWIYQNATIFLERKHNKYQEALDAEKNTGGKP